MKDEHFALLVEDDPVMAAGYGEILTALGHGYTHVRSKEEALELLRRRRFCYVVTDLGILENPDSIMARQEAGFAVISAARARHRDRTPSGEHVVPIILLTGYALDRALVSTARKRGADEVLHKFSVSEKKPALADVIVESLRRGGRTNHDQCAATPLAG